MVARFRLDVEDGSLQRASRSGSGGWRRLRDVGGGSRVSAKAMPATVQCGWGSNVVKRRQLDLICLASKFQEKVM
jgi:hypothetical protein